MPWFASSKKDPVTVLAATIVTTSNTSAKAVLASVKFANEKKKDEAWYLVLCEFMFCFINLTDRMAMRNLGYAKKTRVLEPLGRLVAKLHVEAYLGHWPEHMKVKIEREFLENLNNAQQEYGRCDQINIEGKPFSRDSVIGLFAAHVADTLGDSHDVADLMLATDALARALSSMNLARLIADAAK